MNRLRCVPVSIAVVLALLLLLSVAHSIQQEQQEQQWAPLERPPMGWSTWFDPLSPLHPAPQFHALAGTHLPAKTQRTRQPPPPPPSAAPHCDIFAQVLAIAHKLVEEGFAAAGYTFVNLDDAWSGPMRSSSGRLQGDSQRFPHGMKWLADRLHGMGLKLGL
jgi:hypothetical protein